VEESKSVFVLLNKQVICGVYSSESDLRKGVDDWIAIRHAGSLHYEEWVMNELESVVTWEWAYVRDSDYDNLLKEMYEKNHFAFPRREFVNTNLIGKDDFSQELFKE
jgi:hypothetical protein